MSGEAPGTGEEVGGLAARQLEIETDPGKARPVASAQGAGWGLSHWPCVGTSSTTRSEGKPSSAPAGAARWLSVDL